MNKPVKGKDIGSVKLEEKEIDEDEDDKDDEDVENSSPYQSKMEEHVCDAIPLKEMVNQGQITHVYTVDINHGIHGKANLVTDPNASFDPALRMKKLNADLRTFKSGYLSLDSNGTGIFVQHVEDD